MRGREGAGVVGVDVSLKGDVGVGGGAGVEVVEVEGRERRARRRGIV